jgi:hypothetical protein
LSTLGCSFTREGNELWWSACSLSLSVSNIRNYKELQLHFVFANKQLKSSLLISWEWLLHYIIFTHLCHRITHTLPLLPQRLWSLEQCVCSPRRMVWTKICCMTRSFIPDLNYN